MKHSLLLLFLAGVAACSPRNAALPVLDMETAMGAAQVSDSFSLDDVAEVVAVVPIETRPDALIGAESRLVHIGREHYYVTHDNSVSRIDLAGKVVNTISRQGRGPGEYLRMSPLADVNEREGTIRVFDWTGDKYVTYAMDGSLVSEGALSEKGIELPRYIADDYMVARGVPDGTYRYRVADRDMNVERGLFPMDTTGLDRFARAMSASGVGIGPGRGGALMNVSSEDTLYLVTRHGMTPEAVLRKGRHKFLLPKAGFAPAPLDPSGPKLLLNSDVTALGRYYFVYHTTMGIILEMWDRSDGRLVARSYNMDRPDDFGLKMSMTLSSGRTAIAKITGSVFLVEEDTVAFTADAIHVAGAVDGVREDDNPVIVIAKLKK